MKLPVCYILDKVHDDLEGIGLEDREAGYLVGRPLFYEGEELLEQGRLYLSDGSFPDAGRQETGAFWIGRSKGFHRFYLKEGKSIYILSNRIQRLFEEAEEWYIRMRQCSEAKGTVMDILELAGQYLPYYMAVMEPDFLIMERVLSDGTADADIHGDSGYLKMGIVNRLKQDEFYDAVETYEKPFVYEGRGIEERFLCVNLLENGVFRGRINMRENQGGGFYPWDAFFLECVRDVILPVFLKESRQKEEAKQQREFVRLILEGEQSSQDGLEQFWIDTGWPQRGKYLCIYFKLQTQQQGRELADYYAKELEYLVRQSICVPYENYIFMLHSILEDTEKETGNFDRLNYFIRESDLRMGMSRIYTDVTKSFYAGKQAQIALDYGSLHLPKQWKYRYDEVVLQYLSACCIKELPAEYVGSEALIVLKRRDMERDSRLWETLVCYVKSGFNMVQTAKKLFIHRGTLIYRLNQIQEITEIKWEGWKDKMYLAWSVFLMDQDM